MNSVDSSEDKLPVTKNPWWKAKVVLFLGFVLFLVLVAFFVLALLSYLLNQNSAPPVGGVPTPTAFSSATPTVSVSVSPIR
jgi:hypothetical protein